LIVLYYLSYYRGQFFARKEHQLVKKRYNFWLDIARYYSSLDSSTSHWFYQLEGTKNRVSQSVSEPQSLSSKDLLDDNSLQLRVVNGGTSWFLHNLWCLVNHPIIPSSSVSLSRAASRFSISTLLPSPLTFYRDIICFYKTRQENSFL